MLSSISWSDFGLYLFIALIPWEIYCIIKFWLPKNNTSKLNGDTNGNHQEYDNGDFEEEDLNKFLRQSISNKVVDNTENIAENTNKIKDFSNIYSSQTDVVEENEKVEIQNDEKPDNNSELEFEDNSLEGFFPDEFVFSSEELDKQADDFLNHIQEEGDNLNQNSANEDQPNLKTSESLEETKEDENIERKSEATPSNLVEQEKAPKTFNINFDNFLNDN